MMKIENLKNDQKETVAELWLSNIAQAQDFVAYEYWEALKPNMLRNYLGEHGTIVCETGGRIIAFATAEEDGSIISIVVDKDHRRRGIGCALIDRLKEKYSTLTLSVYTKNEPMVRFCAKNGFVERYLQHDANTGEEERFFEWKKQ